MKQSWYKGLPEERVKDIKANFQEGLVLRNRLKEMLKVKIDESNAGCRQKTTYENPNWALLQADQRWFERALSEIIELLD